MKGDFSRLLAAPLYAGGVLQQQGRVLLDSDFNEYVTTLAALLQTIAADVIGTDGAPAAAPLSVGPNTEGALTILAGRYYAGGMLVSNPADVAFARQPFVPVASLPTESGAYAAVLRVWQRTVNWVQAPIIRDVALGGVDTTVRLQNVWQIFIETLPPASEPPVMQARVSPPSTVGNYFYRVEIHAPASPGDLTSPTFKWSRTNGSAIAQVVYLDSASDDMIVARVEAAGVDPATLLPPGQWVEYVDDAVDLQQLSFPLWQVVSLESLGPTSARLRLSAAAPGDRRPFDPELHPFLRAWDQQQSGSAPLAGGAVPITPGAWQPLESGIEICFPTDSAAVQPGDYWQFPSRTASGGVAWPLDDKGQPLPQPKNGIDFTLVPLADVSLDGTKWSVTSNVKTFTPLLGAGGGGDAGEDTASLRKQIAELQEAVRELKGSKKRR